MSNIDPNHLVSELRENINNQDLIKANLVLQYWDQIDLKTQNRLLQILEQGDPEFVGPVLSNLVRNNPEMAAQQPRIKEAIIAVALQDPGFLFRAIEDKIPPREMFVSVAGELSLTGTSEILQNALTREMDEQILTEIIKAMGQLGDPTAVNAISEYLYSNHRSLMLAAVTSLGRIGSPTAMQRLAEKMGSDTQLDLLILDVFSRVQDQVSLGKLNQVLSSHYAHLRNFAKAKMVRVGAKAVPMLCENLLREDPDLLIHTLNVLGEIKDPSSVASIRKLLGTEPGDPNVRFAAYEALGNLPLDKGAYILARGLTDPEEQICVVAASAIDRNLNPVLTAGVKNMVRQRDSDALKTVRSIIRAQAKNLFMALLEEEVFQELAVRFLSSNAPPDDRKYFYQLLNEGGYPDLAQRMEPDRPAEKIRPMAAAVDDSRMILNIYKSVLYELGYDPVLFEFPQQALEWIASNKPEIVFTDLNMPAMTGVELISRIREIYPEEELPVIMVTTQNEVQDNEKARLAGVSAITFKPFSADSLRKATEGARAER